MANVNSKPTYQAHLSKTGFDVSQTFNFSSSCGHILPVWYDIANPGEHYSLSTNLFTRTQPLASAPMVDIDEYIDWFFVPFSLIYGNFDSWIYGINDQHSSLMVDQLKNGGSIALPCIDATGGNYNASPSGLDIHNRFPSNTGEPRFEDWNRMAARLCDHLEQVPFKALHQGSQLSFPFYNFAAYQCICDRYYRNTQYVNSNVKAYNFDDLLGVPKCYLGWSNVPPGNSQVSTEIDVQRVNDLFRLHYRPYALDYFTNVQPSPLQNATNMLASTTISKGSQSVPDSAIDMLLKVNNWLDPDNGTNKVVNFNSDNKGDGTWTTSNNLHGILSPGATTNVTNTSTTFSTNLSNLRSSFAIEKLLSITQRAGKHYDDQTLAHFGIKTDKDKYHDVLCIGQHKQQIHIGEVIATATTAGDESSTLGEIAGKGYGSGDSKKFSFDVPCHGIIMACYSCVPRLKRQIDVNKLNMRVHREDFFQPEFDNLGMQPLFGYEVNGRPLHAESENPMGDGSPYAIPNNKVCAWQYRYMESKVKYDRTSKAFLPEYPFQSWTITTDFQTPILGSGVVSTGKMFTDFVSSLFCSPNALDQVMLVGYDSSPIKQESGGSEVMNETTTIPYIYKQVYARDPLFHNLRINAYKTSSMSAYGLPRLD